MNRINVYKTICNSTDFEGTSESETNKIISDIKKKFIKLLAFKNFT